MLSLSYFVPAAENGLEQVKTIRRGHLFVIFLPWVLPRDNNWGPEEPKEPLTVAPQADTMSPAQPRLMG